VNTTMQVGQVATTITVEETPLVNSVDTTNGYILDRAQIEAIPLPTGSFTGLAILSPGVNAELPAGTGANAGLGNQPIWANGQRDTSNTFLLNGVDASNLFNGKSTSQVASARIVNNTGVAGAGSTTAQIIQSTASPYLAIGQAIPTPVPETVQEFHMNTSMYDAQQGSTSGAHIDMNTSSGTNTIHGGAYIHKGTDWLNAALSPIYLPSFTPVEGPQARRFANAYTRLFVRYPGLEDSKLGTEGMSGGEKFKMGYNIASASVDIAMSGFTPISAISSVQDAISITRTIHSAMASLSVSFATWEKSVDDQQQLLAGKSFKAIPTQPVNLAFVQDTK